ncbi:MAG: hypothetical protein J5778_04980 [Clostridiales bacterium]|nr:hypothetical protein [Clostridiales bacterium]
MLKKQILITISLSILSCALFGCTGNIKESETTTTEKASEKTSSASIDIDAEGESDATSISFNILNDNHGHSISETPDERPREIRRSDSVIYNKDQAWGYLVDSVDLPYPDMSFKLVDTSDDDPGAYMWYEFLVCCGGIAVENAEFYVIAFTDGTICEGRSEIVTASFESCENTKDPEEILSIYQKENNDKNEYLYKDMCYLFMGNANEHVKLTYRYRHESMNILEGSTIYLDAKTGERVGYYKDAIT